MTMMTMMTVPPVVVGKPALGRRSTRVSVSTLP
jgi:hypothetical protein